RVHTEPANRSAGSAAPPEGEPQGLKPDRPGALSGTAEAVPFPKPMISPNPIVSPNPISPNPVSPKPMISPVSPVSPDKIVTGHTLDDQAETVLMRMIRGSGFRGLGGIYPRMAVEDDDGELCGEIVRPLLGFRRRELEQYLKDIGQSWREDSTN